MGLERGSPGLDISLSRDIPREIVIRRRYPNMMIVIAFQGLSVSRDCF